jgi:transcriptional regulator with XRE-family HTH domain
MPIDFKVIGNRIKNERKLSKQSQESLAEKLNISTSFQSRMERGATTISLDMLTRISEALNIPLSRLVTGVADCPDESLDDKLSSATNDFSPNEKRLLLDIANLIKRNR